MNVSDGLDWTALRMISQVIPRKSSATAAFPKTRYQEMQGIWRIQDVQGNGPPLNGRTWAAYSGQWVFMRPMKVQCNCHSDVCIYAHQSTSIKQWTISCDVFETRCGLRTLNKITYHVKSTLVYKPYICQGSKPHHNVFISNGSFWPPPGTTSGPLALLPWRHLRLSGAKQSSAEAELHFTVTLKHAEEKVGAKRLKQL